MKCICRCPKTILLFAWGILPFLPKEGLAADKSKYTIISPTPEKEMRELSTDRPDKTESPYTVDAGHFQIETDLMILSRDVPAQNITQTSTSYAVSNLKVGLTNSSDLQIIVAPLITEHVSNPEGNASKAGHGDTILRLKINLVGNDHGEIALGIMPFVQIPSHSNGLGSDKWEGGLILPFALSLPHEWDLGLMSQWNWVPDETDQKYHSEYITTMTVGHGIWGELAGYCEFFSQSSKEEGSPWIATLDFGLTYGATPNIQFDMGVNIGVTKAADDLNPFVGISARI